MICVDYRNLNETTPKDESPILMADMLIIDALIPRNKKELQSLLGKINFLRRANSAGKVQAFSSLLKIKEGDLF